MTREEYLEVYRHSLSHILAKAVVEIFGKENVQLAIGPQIADGFYYDFTLPRTLVPADFTSIENKMREILKRKEAWTRREVTREEALKIFAGQNPALHFHMIGHTAVDNGNCDRLLCICFDKCGIFVRLDIGGAP